ncbi:1-acyl-sn-glycerol-3-phosphate acyltransferase [Actinacidiphila yanglinensis]|uniref:1-acyl-sn-glycerol-3-phosphate acyltransferase n=1 Tax=Actinacidiphila yanglinensis TaxID=310779 RepID=A0A1H6BZM7_9ACTN|nr:lysophospholipid acyltransferase family protein [Actinacidiphila yanglinensis]SEG65937.1 1-acyl-sn-glycerol-3-phosphate acyltransferase [Actinacidiphila yanglinensis]
MTDAKVLPFGDDARRRGSGGGTGARRSRGRERKPGAPAPAQKAESGPQAPLAAVPEDGPGIPAQADGSEPAAAADGPRDEAPAGSGPDASDTSDASGSGPGTSLPAALGAVADRLLGGPWEQKVAAGLSFLRRRVTGDYDVDEFGFDPDLTDQVLLSLLRPMYEGYFRVEVKGIENIPAEGGALVVSNHSGTLPIDALMTQVAVHDHHPAGRHLRLLAADLVFVLPVVNELARKAGHTLACAEDAQLLLERGEVVGVMPEGFKGIGKPFSERYKLQRFGRGGFVATALKTRVPIVPCSVVGAEEIYPMIGNSRTLARILGIPYFPLTPTFPWLGPLGLLPLPTKWTIQFGEPIATDTYPPEAADDPMLVFNLTDQVRETIQHTLYELLVERRSVFF